MPCIIVMSELNKDSVESNVDYPHSRLDPCYNLHYGGPGTTYNAGHIGIGTNILGECRGDDESDIGERELGEYARICTHLVIVVASRNHPKQKTVQRQSQRCEADRAYRVNASNRGIWIEQKNYIF